MEYSAWQQYEDDMFRHIVHYTITEFLGRAHYLTTKYSDLNICAKVYRDIKRESPNRRVLVYAVCQPPNRQLTVSLPIAEDKLP